METTTSWNVYKTIEATKPDLDLEPADKMPQLDLWKDLQKLGVALHLDREDLD